MPDIQGETPVNDLLTIDELRLALTHIPADERETWVNIGNAVKTEYGDEGFMAWDEWSQGADSYNASAAKSVWRSLQPGHVRLGTIIKLAANNGWKREKRELSAEDRKRLAIEAEERRKQRQVEVEADDARREAMQQAVGMACRLVCQRHMKPVGGSEYLGRKRVGAHGVLFPAYSILISIDDKAQRAEVWAGEEVGRFFADLPKPRPDHISFMLIKRGAIVLPLRDVEGRIWSIQVIQPNGTKLFPKYGKKAGLWHMLGSPDGAEILAAAEGYATAASIHEAMGWPVAVALDSGNLPRVAGCLHLLYPDAQMVVCGDDDPTTKGNPGRTKAELAAKAVDGVAVFPPLCEVA